MITATVTTRYAIRKGARRGVRKFTYVDPDGNEIGFGGGPLEETDVHD